MRCRAPRLLHTPDPEADGATNCLCSVFPFQYFPHSPAKKTPSTACPVWQTLPMAESPPAVTTHTEGPTLAPASLLTEGPGLSPSSREERPGGARADADIYWAFWVLHRQPDPAGFGSHLRQRDHVKIYSGCKEEGIQHEITAPCPRSGPGVSAEQGSSL